MKSIYKRMADLEKKVAAMEECLRSGKEATSDMIGSWESVLLEFADTFGLSAKQFRAKRQPAQVDIIHKAAFRKKYNTLSALRPVFEAIDSLTA